MTSGDLTIPVAVAQDPRLSLLARGIYVALASDPGTQADCYELAAESSETPAEIRLALAELEEAGYLTDRRAVR